MNIYEQQAGNRRMTWIVMSVFVALFLVIGAGFDFFFLNFRPGRPAAFSGFPFGAAIALLAGAGMAVNGLYNGREMVLRSTMARKAAAESEKERRLLNVVSEMALAAGLVPPAVYVVPDADLNAFATGTKPENSVIAVTQGLLDSLNREELQAVVAHEMSHIRNYDMRLMTVSAALTGAIALLSDLAGRSMRFRSIAGSSGGSGGRNRNGGGAGLIFFVLWLLLMALAPLLSRLLAMAISREREYLADASGAELTRNPMALVSALEKIRAAAAPTYAINNGVAHMCITDPRGSLIEDKMGLAADLFATHPPMQKRILALKAMSYQA